MNIVEKVKALDFPDGEYIVVGSGILGAKNIREIHDVDIVVSSDLFEKCKNDGWEQAPWTYEKIGQIYLKKAEYELYLDVNCRDFNPTLRELLQRAEMIEGVPFASLEDSVSFKRVYGKPKHLRDIELIERFENSRSGHSAVSL